MRAIRFLRRVKRPGKKLGGDRGVVPTERARALATAAIKARAAARAVDLAPIIADLRAAGATSLNAIAAGLTEKGISTPRNGSRWTATQVGRLLAAL
jgi:Recombinase